MVRGRRQPTGLEDAISATLEKRRSQSTIRHLTTNDPTSVDFSSNDFLSLASCEELRRIFLAELEAGPSGLGSGGSRLLDGNSGHAEHLERTIATFHNAPAGLLCNSGFDANVGLYSCLPQPGDVIIYDEFIHASVHDGMRLSRAGKCVAFAHNDVGALAATIDDCIRSDPSLLQGRRNVFVAVETVYSMDGDIAPLKDMVDLVKDLLPNGNGHLIVDEAHSTGIYGPKGAGLVCELGLEDEITVRLHTFGKALACNGAILLCSPLIRQYLVNYARPLIYTTFMSYPALAAIKASYRFLSDGKTVQRAENLRHLIRYLHNQLLDLQERGPWRHHESETVHSLLRVPTECPQSPIFSVLTSEPKALAAYCQSRGFVVRGIVPPTVPAGAERVRICLHAGNTDEQIDSLIVAIRGWVMQRLEVVKQEVQIRPRL